MRSGTILLAILMLLMPLVSWAQPLSVRHGEWVTFTGVIHNVWYSWDGTREILRFTLTNDLLSVTFFSEGWQAPSLHPMEQGLQTASYASLAVPVDEFWRVTARGRFDAALNLVWLQWVQIPWEIRTQSGEIQRGKTVIETEKVPAVPEPVRETYPSSPIHPGALPPESPSGNYEIEGYSFYGGQEAGASRRETPMRQSSRSSPAIPYPYYFRPPEGDRTWYYQGTRSSGSWWSPVRGPVRSGEDEPRTDPPSTIPATPAPEFEPPFVIEPVGNYQGPSPRLNEMRGNAERMGYGRRMILQHQERSREILGR